LPIMSERKIRVSPIKGVVGSSWNSFALFNLGFGGFLRKPYFLTEERVALWQVEGEGGYFDLVGTRLYISLEDIYFLTGLLKMGLIETPHPILLRG